MYRSTFSSSLEPRAGGWSWSSAEARVSVEAADHSELPPASSSVGQRGRPGLPTHKAAKANRGPPAGLFSLACWGPQ